MSVRDFSRPFLHVPALTLGVTAWLACGFAAAQYLHDIVDVDGLTPDAVAERVLAVVSSQAGEDRT